MKLSLLPVTLLALSLLSQTGVADPPGKALPPGLEKKLERGGELPPGWEKKLRVGEILDTEVYAHARIVVPIDDEGLITVAIEGRMLRLARDSRRIIEILQ